MWLSGHVRTRDSGGRNIYADCPVCRKSAKLRVKKATGRWNCFSCEQRPSPGWKGRGSLPALVSFLEKKDFGQAIAFIRKESGLPNEWREEHAPAEGIPETAIPLLEVPSDHPAWQNLEKRGLLHLGDRISIEVIGKYHGRFILPCLFMGETRGFEAKTYSGQTPKALYPTWFQANQEIYTTPVWDYSCGSAIMTESIFDAETFGQNACGLYGSKFTPGRLSRLLELRKHGVRNLFWAMDPDAWFEQARHILCSTAGLFTNHYLPLPKYTENGEKADPNALGRGRCLELIGEAVRVDSEADLIERSVEMLTA